MPATITDKYKRYLLDDLYASFNSDSDIYYVGIGRSEEWPDDDVPPAPFPSHETIHEFQSSLQGVKRVLDCSYVVPRHNWSAGSIYTAWNDKNSSETTIGPFKDIEGPYYVITDDNNVYVCLQQGMTNDGRVRNSIYKPTKVDENPFSAGPDGYIWKFLYNVGTYNSRRYLTSHWIPVEHIVDSDIGGPPGDELSASRLAQALIQHFAEPGQVLGVEVDSGGVGYTTPPIIKIRGTHTGDSAQAYARLDEEGRIFQVVMKDSADDINFRFGKDYGEKTWITVEGGGGTGASLRPIIHTDSGGFGFDPRKDLNSSALMYSARLIGDEYKVFNIRNNFRQVGLIKNPLKDSSTADLFSDSAEFTDVRGSALKKIYVGSGILADNTDLDNTVTGLNSGAMAILDYYDTYIDSDCCDSTQNTSHNVLYVHQTQETGFKPFDKTEAVELNYGAGSANIIAHTDPQVPAARFGDVLNFSGDVLYVDNRVQIERDEDQTEDIKIVIDL